MLSDRVSARLLDPLEQLELALSGFVLTFSGHARAQALCTLAMVFE